MPSEDGFTQLTSSQLAQVWFVRDYLQLIFEDDETHSWTCLAWPEVVIESEHYRFGDAEYRDALCSLIGHDVSASTESDVSGLEVSFDSASIRLNPEEDELAGPEIALLHSGSLLSVWRLGEGIFSRLA